ncbi:MAG TPA: glyoxalase [Nitrosomonas nitrosa]|jgi:catechol 2,3-dioxygenase-like lactoylglutathione lyase family enzyme|uniref:Catechol 2,3-dioxygenase n=1 Tax=Nitrosomonas nitrosa TaxID=52442 RepID=A0A1I4QBU4_9PROT|nr:VOC family protein [Nitrosomonas nitrosa]MCO6433418.1 VOC family protein [Nitrosomonas nitrosa]PTQ95480.1 catechol 2,3-dioxygenase-like lactoylglutathione lyase family enzyme [Nitrosomonas nitrosa]CAE6501217.1 Catechol 2,3-dioxygenase [Nitrosomonas nitrosa]SFM37517.1 Catechol 2,3-dioxygenase [Nitrosomonas nitrosa]HBZ30583.1 glyoxalase [Nitrosomonas nitrosa]
MAIDGMNHFTVLTSDLEKSKAFYIGVLGLTEGYRPPFAFPGAWLYSGDQAILHIIAGKPLPVEAQGVIDHMAFTASNLQVVVDTLNQHGIPFKLHRLVGEHTWQLFCHDPDGAKVELDFAASEPEPRAINTQLGS